jgi:hypothetical protein
MPPAETAATDDERIEDGFEDEQAPPEAAPVTTEAKPDKVAKEADTKAVPDPEKVQLLERVREAEQNAQYWHGQARNAPQQREPKKAEEPKKLSEDPVEAISSGDPERMRKVFRELGFVEASEVDRRVNEKAGSVVSEQQMYTDYPELRDAGSPFFKATATEYQRLARDPAMAKSPSLMSVAAELAAMKTGRTKPGESEAERAVRVDRQSGDRGRKPASRGTGGESEELTAGQRSVIAKFQAAGAPLTDESYSARAKKGVQMGGTPTRKGNR